MPFQLTARMLRRAPWFSAACIGTVAISIGLASSVFAVVDGVLFKRLPYADPDELVLVSRVIEDPVRREQLRQGTGRAGSAFSRADLQKWRQAHPDLQISAFFLNFGIGPVAGTGVMQETTWAACVDPMFFTVLGAHPLIGGFQDEHYLQPYRSGNLRAHPAVISYRLWRRIQTSGDLALPDDLLRVGDGTLQVVGILPADFVFPSNFGRTSPDVLLPLALASEGRSLQGIARLPEGVTVPVAAERLRDAVLEPVDHALGLRERSAFRLAFTAVLIVVLLGSLNVAVLLASRGRDRARELAVRTALGASPARLLKLMLAEASAIGTVGAALGVLAAKPLLSVAIATMPASYLLIKPPTIDTRVLAFAVATALSTLLSFAAWPAVKAARTSAYGGLGSERGSTPADRTWRRAALAAQSAAGMLVVLAGTLLVAGFAALWHEDAGLERRHTAVVDVTARGVADPVRQRALLEDAQAIATRVSGVERVSALTGPFLRNAIAGSMFVPPPGSVEVVAQDVPIAAGLFETAGIRLVAGRFPATDEIISGRPVAAVSDTLARAFWPGRDPIGQVLTSRSGAGLVVVGVVKDIRIVGLEESRPTAEIYVPLRLASPRPDRVLILRAAGHADEIAARVAATIMRERPELFVTRAESIDRALAITVRGRQFQSTLFGTFAVATLVLLGVGMFGAIVMHVASRKREIGVRMALGATSSTVRRMILVENLGPVIVGIIIGCGGSWWTTGLLDRLVYGVGSHDVMSWSLAALFVIGTALIAAWLPASSASRVDPQVVLRAQ